MTQFIITSKGFELLQTGATRAADMLEVASSIAKDGKVDQDELMKEFDLYPEQAQEVLEGLVHLGLIKPADSLPPQRYHKQSHLRM